jgi:hypothetical protein
MDLLMCRPDNPFRPVDWRWQRACLLIEKRVRLRRWDDSWVRRVRRFQRTLTRYRGDLQHPRLTRLDSAVAGACWLRFLAEEGARTDVESSILNGQSDEAIAAQSDLPAATIEAYQALFFHVRDRLHCVDWLAAFVAGPAVAEQVAELILTAWGIGSSSNPASAAESPDRQGDPDVEKTVND